MRYLTKSAFAEDCGVSRQAVTKATLQGGPLFNTLKEGRIDTKHPDAVAYKTKGIYSSRPPGSASPVTKSKHQQAGVQNPITHFENTVDMSSVPTLEAEEFHGLGDMPLRTIVSKYGTFPQFKDLVNAAKSIEQGRAALIKNEQALKTLVSRDLVYEAFVDPVNTAHNKLLSDGSRTIAREAKVLFEAGKSKEDLEIKIRSIVSSFLTKLQENITKGQEVLNAD